MDTDGISSYSAEYATMCFQLFKGLQMMLTYSCVLTRLQWNHDQLLNSHSLLEVYIWRNVSKVQA